MKIHQKDMPVLGFGTYQLTGEVCKNAVKIALTFGYRHIDTAEYYGNEEQIAEAVKGFPREDLFITSKVWRDNLRYQDVLRACLASLKRLNTSYIDLYLVHWPNKNIPLEETFEALHKLKKEGKIRAFGVSNFTISHLKKALSISKEGIYANQVEFHPWLYQRNLLMFCRENNIKIIAYSPLARARFFSEPALEKLSAKYRKSPAQLCLRWLLQQGITAIPKARSEEHIRENMNVFDFVISEEDMAILSKFKQERLVKPDFHEFGAEDVL